jgi:glycosyltransferase involved in cell wall biosynthesis
MLDRFLTGFYLTKSGAGPLLKAIPQLGNYVLDAPRQSAMVPSLSYVAYKLGLPFASRKLKKQAMWRCLAAFDRAVAKRLHSLQGGVFAGFEYSSVDSFREARRLGWTTVLEASSVHYSYQLDALRGTPMGDQISATSERKQLEIDLADRIIVLSSLARDTYVRAGVDAKRIVTIAPYVSPIAPAAAPAARQRDGQPVRFLYAGNLGHHKGTDLLLEAFGSLSMKASQLRIVGGSLANTPSNVEVLARVPRAQLARHYSWADFLVLPSRFDGYGFVVAEALMMGVPVIVSDAVGAADLVEPGKNGWVFQSGDGDSLRDAMSHAAAARDQWQSFSSNAMASAAAVSRGRYVERVAAAYGAIVSEPEAA